MQKECVIRCYRLITQKTGWLTTIKTLLRFTTIKTGPLDKLWCNNISDHTQKLVSQHVIDFCSAIQPAYYTIKAFLCYVLGVSEIFCGADNQQGIWEEFCSINSQTIFCDSFGFNKKRVWNMKIKYVWFGESRWRFIQIYGYLNIYGKQ